MNNSTTSERNLVASFFGRYAIEFDSIYGHKKRRNSFQKGIDFLFRNTMFLRFKRTLHFIDNPEIKTVIDIGCGPAHYCVEFLKKGKKVTALDFSDEMVKIAQQNISNQNLKGEINYIVSDYMDYPFNEKFDAAVLTGFFDYIKEPIPLVKKLKKDIGKEIYASFPKSKGILAFQRKIRYRQRNCPLYLYCKDDVTDIMQAAGIANFEITSCQRDWFVRIKF
jgi:SAM-dependent methyltransferase